MRFVRRSCYDVGGDLHVKVIRVKMKKGGKRVGREK